MFCMGQYLITPTSHCQLTKALIQYAQTTVLIQPPLGLSNRVSSLPNIDAFKWRGASIPWIFTKCCVKMLQQHDQL